MDFRFLVSTFFTILLAEMGDKTQLTAMSLTAGGASRWATFVACSAALVCSTAIAVTLGEMLTQVVPLLWLKRGAAVGFVGMGVGLLWSTRLG